MHSCGRNIVLSQARVAVRLLQSRLEGVLPDLRFSCKSRQNKEPTSGLEPLTCSSYECAVRRCRGLHRLANSAYLSLFLFSTLLRVAPYCVPGGIRVVSGAHGCMTPVARPSWSRRLYDMTRY